MTDSAHSRIEELIAAYALDALDDVEGPDANRQLIDHLSSCPSCQRLFAELRETAAEMALAAPHRPLNPTFHDQVMAAVRAEAHPVVVRTGTTRGVRLVLAAAVVAVLGLGGLSAELGGRLGQVSDRQSRAEEALALVNDPAARTIQLAGSGSDGRATLVARPDGAAVLLGSRLRLPEDRVFEVWLVRGTEMIPAATFVPNGGRAVVPVRLDPGHDQAIAITIERRRVDQPTTGPVLHASLST